MANAPGPREQKLRAMREENAADIPDFLLVKNRVALTPEQERRVAEAAKPAKTGAEAASAAATGMTNEERLKALKKEKSRGRIAKFKAKLAGATTALPATGKHALAIINQQAPADAAAQPKKETATMATATKKTPKTKTRGKKPAKTAHRKPATANGKPARSAARADGGIRPGSKLELVAGLLKRPGGCTTADVLAATSWPAVSMPQMAKAAGLTLKKTKEKGSPTRYSA